MSNENENNAFEGLIFSRTSHYWMSGCQDGISLHLCCLWGVSHHLERGGGASRQGCCWVELCCVHSIQVSSITIHFVVAQSVLLRLLLTKLLHAAGGSCLSHCALISRIIVTCLILQHLQVHSLLVSKPTIFTKHRFQVSRLELKSNSGEYA